MSDFYPIDTRSNECIEIPEWYATCPECQGALYVEIVETTVKDGKPTTSCPVGCIAEAIIEGETDQPSDHRWWQSDWQQTIDAAHAYIGAVDI